MPVKLPFDTQFPLLVTPVDPSFAKLPTVKWLVSPLVKVFAMFATTTASALLRDLVSPPFVLD